MTLIARLISLFGITATAAMTLLMFLTFRKERPVRALPPLLTVLLSLGILLLLVLVSGARLNLLYGLILLVLGLGVGLVRGLATRFSYRNGVVWGKNSMLFLLGWGASLVLAQLINLLGSGLLASIGLAGVYFSTGTQVGMHGLLFLRRLLYKPSSLAPAR